MLDKYFQPLVIVIPFALISGPFISDLITTILALFFLFNLFNKKLWNIFNITIVKIIIVFSVYIFFRSIFSQNPLLSFESSLFYFRFLFSALAIALLVNKFPNTLNLFGYSLWSCIILLTVDGFFQFYFGYNLFGMTIDTTTRISGLFGEELILGSYLSRLFPLAIYFLLLNNNENIWKIIIIVFSLISLDLLIYISGERSAFFNLLLGSIIIILLTKKYRLIRFFTFIISILIIIFITFTQPTVKSRMVDFTLSQLGINEFSENSGSKNVYTSHIKSSLSMFKENILFGKGPKMYRELCKLEKFDYNSCSTHPHNTYLQLLAETGLVGFFFFAGLFLFCLIKMINQFFNIYFFKNEHKIIADSTICLFACFFISLWPIVPTGNVFSNWLNIVYYLPLGFFLAEKLKINKVMI